MPVALVITARGFNACGACREDAKARRKYKNSQCDAFSKVIGVCGACYEGTISGCHGATAMCVGMVGSHPVT